MNRVLRGSRFKRGFTIVELIVVIAVIAILAVIAIVSYAGWQTSIRTAAVKNDLNAVATTLEDLRNTSSTGGYPTTEPPFTRSPNVQVLFTSLTTTEYCIDASSTQDNAVKYYLYSRTKDAGPVAGDCSIRTDLTPPISPSSVSIASTTGTTAIVNWPSVADASSYIAQCASDPAFIYGPQQTTVTNNTGTVSATVNNLTNSTSFYCRVKAINAKGASAWSGSNTATATDATYNGLAVGTSIEGYFTSAPQGFLVEDGSAVSRTTYSALFSVIGTTYGAGDTKTTFNLPDSRGRTTVTRNVLDAEFATLGQLTGSKVEQITIAQLPSHTHIQNPHDHNSGKPNPYVTAGGGGIAVTSKSGAAFGFKYNTTTPSPSTVATNQTTGGDVAHNNIQPSIVKLSAIKFAVPDSGAQTLPEGSSISGYWSAAPTGYLLEDGASVSRASYPELFAAIGTTYGSVNGSSFNLPNSKGKTSVNISSVDTEFNTMGEITGSKREQLSVAQIPSHTHIQNPHNHNSGLPNPYVSDSSLGGISVSSLGGADFGFTLRPAPSTTATNQNTGGDQDHNNIQPSIVKLSAIKTTPSVGASGKSVPTGTSQGGWWISAPSGYLFEDGSAVSRTTYSDLFAVIGTSYGTGDGTTTFNLPDSRGRIGVNLKSTDVEFDTMGEKYGEKSHVLTIAEMASHTHIQNAHDHNSGIVYISDGSFGGVATTTANGASYGFTLIAQPSVTATNQNTGGGLGHNEIQPTIVKRFLIKY